MATMILRETDGAREFRVPFTEPLPGAPFHGSGELVLETAGPAAKPTRIAMRFFPSIPEFQARLPGLVNGGPLEASLFNFGEASSKRAPIVVFEGDAEALAVVPYGLVNLELFERFLADGQALFDFTHYNFANIEFLMGKTGD